MPEYTFVIDGQRHLFEGPDPQTTAQFARQWAASQPAARGSAAAGPPARGPAGGQFAADLGARARQDVADLTSAIDQVRAHPTRLDNAPRILGAVARYVPNAFGLAPAAGVDQLTGPVIRGINARFGTHFDPRYVTDQLLNAAGLLSGAGELSAAERAPLRGPAPVGLRSAAAVDRDAPAAVAPHPPGLPPSGPGPSAPRPPPTLGQPELVHDAEPTLAPGADRARPPLSVAYEAPTLGGHVLGQNSKGENVVPLSDGFLAGHQQRAKGLEDLPDDVQDRYHSAIDELILDPTLDDPDYGGPNAEEVQQIGAELARRAAAERGAGGDARIADALDAAGHDFVVMVNQQQPQMAKDLGLAIEREPAAGAPMDSAADEGDPTNGAGARLITLERHLAPEPPQRPNQAMFDDLVKLPVAQMRELMNNWRTRAAGNDSAPIGLQGQSAQILPFERPLPPELAAWRANSDAAGQAPEDTRPDWEPAPGNAFASPTSLAQTIAARATRPMYNFNALRPPSWLGPLVAAAANQSAPPPAAPQN